jgi:hypothetical protein
MIEILMNGLLVFAVVGIIILLLAAAVAALS